MSPPCTCTVTHSIGSLEGQDARLSSMGPWVCMSLSPYFLLWQQFYQTGSEGKPATRTKALPFYRFDFSNCAAVGDFGFLFAKKCCHQDRKWEKKWSPGYQWNPTPVLYFPHSHLNPEKSYGTSRVEAYTCRDVSNQLGSKECYFIFSHLSFSQMCHLPKQEKLTSATFSYGVGGETVEFSWGGVQGLYEQGGVLPPQPGARNCSSGSKRCFFYFFF